MPDTKGTNNHACSRLLLHTSPPLCVALLLYLALPVRAERLNEMKDSQHGSYQLVTSEKALLDVTTSKTSPRVIVHFFHKDFRRCKIMDSHLEPLAKKHFKTRFVKIDVESAPFLVERLQIQVLPCVIAFKDGISVDRYVEQTP